jgi:hypothetical protein
LQRIVVDLYTKSIPYCVKGGWHQAFGASCLELLARTLLFVQRVSSPILEVLACSLRTHAVEYGRVIEYSPFKAIFRKKIQSMIEAHVSPE